MENPLGPPLSPLERQALQERQLEMAKRRLDDYIHIEGDDPPTAGLLLWYGGMIDHNPKGSYQLAAGSCAVEAALHPDENFTLENRLELIRQAILHWDRAFDAEVKATNDIAERAKWAACQVPTYDALAAFLEGTDAAAGTHELQERRFKAYFQHILSRWPYEDLRGHALESLCSYFLHRSNPMRPDERPIYALPATIREDYHPDARKRIDVSVFDLNRGMKHGIQVKAGRARNPYEHDSQLFRIFLSRASKLLCLPYTKSHLLCTIKSIVDDNPRYRNDLDTIAADHRARIIQQVVIPGYIATPIVNRLVSPIVEG